VVKRASLAPRVSERKMIKGGSRSTTVLPVDHPQFRLYGLED
jgi:hypothetical protein